MQWVKTYSIWNVSHFSLADLTVENERLNEEKDVLVESLLAQTEKLEREREERMKVLLFHNIHSDASKSSISYTDVLLLHLWLWNAIHPFSSRSFVFSDTGEAGANGASRGSKSPSGSGLLSDREQQLMDLIKVSLKWLH